MAEISPVAGGRLILSRDYRYEVKISGEEYRRKEWGRKDKTGSEENGREEASRGYIRGEGVRLMLSCRKRY